MFQNEYGNTAHLSYPRRVSGKFQGCTGLKLGAPLTGEQAEQQASFRATNRRQYAPRGLHVVFLKPMQHIELTLMMPRRRARSYPGYSKVSFSGQKDCRLTSSPCRRVSISSWIANNSFTSRATASSLPRGGNNISMRRTSAI